MHERLRREPRASAVRLNDARIARGRRLMHGRIMLLRLQRRRLYLPGELLEVLFFDIVGLCGHRQRRAQVQVEHGT